MSAPRETTTGAGIAPATLQGLQAFAGLSDRQREVVAGYLGRLDCSPGQAVVVESAAADRLAFVLKGQLSLRRGQGPKAVLRAGEHFGVQAVFDERKYGATVVAQSPCELLELTQARLADLRREHPDLAYELLRDLLDGTLSRAQAMLPSGAELVAERSLPRVDDVEVLVEGERRQAKVGTPYGALLPARRNGLLVVAALVDAKTTSLSTRVSSRVRVEPLTMAHWEGQRVYRHSLALLALEAARQLVPTLRIKVGPSVGFGRRLLVPDLIGARLAEFRGELESKMLDLARSGLRLREELWTVDEAREYFASVRWVEAEQLLDTWAESTVPLVTYGTVYAINTLPLLPTLSALLPFHVVCDNDILLIVYGKSATVAEKLTRTMPPRALTDLGEVPPPQLRPSVSTQARSVARFNHDVSSEEQSWLKALEVTSVGAFNRACVRGSVPQLIRVVEGFQEKRLTRIADEVLDRVDQVDAICIAGPSSSGKTTFIRRLCVQLQVNGIGPVALGLDDYYLDRELTPRDDSGDYDFETLDAINLPLLHEHLRRIFAGESVQTARYDFAAGRCSPEGGATITLGKREILVMEGIHGLNPRLLGNIDPERVFRVFVCPLAQLSFDHLSRFHASDVRLVRRIVRDRHARGFSAAETILRWPKVRGGERLHIFPYQSNANAVFDTSLIYELSVLKVYAERYLLEVPHDSPAYATAFRLLHDLSRFVGIYPDHVPPTSILREFIGGSGFEY